MVDPNQGRRTVLESPTLKWLIERNVESVRMLLFLQAERATSNARLEVSENLRICLDWEIHFQHKGEYHKVMPPSTEPEEEHDPPCGFGP